MLSEAAVLLPLILGFNYTRPELSATQQTFPKRLHKKPSPKKRHCTPKPTWLFLWLHLTFPCLEDTADTTIYTVGIVVPRALQRLPSPFNSGNYHKLYIRVPTLD